MTSSELNSTIQRQEKEGFAIYLIHSRYTAPSGFRYCAVFREASPLIEVHAYWNTRPFPHLVRRLKLLNNKWSLMCQSFTSVPTIASVNAVYHRDRRLTYNTIFENPEKGKVYEGLTFVQFNKRTVNLNNYYLEYASSYYYPATSDITRLSTIYKQYPSRNRYQWLRWGMNKTQALDQIEQNSDQWDPVYTVPYKHDGLHGYIVGWYLKRL